MISSKIHSSNPDLILNPIAIRPRVMIHRIEWEDTSWGTAFEIDKIDMKKVEKNEYPQEIKIVNKKGEVIFLTLLDLETYNANVKKRVVGQVGFLTDEELQHYYLTTDFFAY